MILSASGLAIAMVAMPSHAAADQRNALHPTDHPAAAVDFAGMVADRMGVDRATAARRLATQDAQLKSLDGVMSKLGKHAGGAYFDDDGNAVVAVTDEAAAASVRAAGMRSRVVKRSLSELESVRDTLNQHAGNTGATWGIDVRDNRVVVTVANDAKVNTERRNALLRAANKFDDAVRVEYSKGEISTTAPLLGGYPIYPSTGGRCSAGFNVTNGSAYYLLTAGHCTAGYPFWYNYDGSAIGPTAHSYYPGADFGLVANYYATPYPGVYLWNGYYQPMYYVGNSYVNLYTCKSGSTTGLTCGYVLQTGATADYGNGPVYNLVLTNVCAEPGDSGGSQFTENTALGLTSGGLLSGGRCLPYPYTRTFFYPVAIAMNYYGVRLI